jgi:hypothetical protein
MAALDNIASELLKSANEADLNYKKTRDQAQRDKAVRLRRIVGNLKNVVLGASDLNGLSDVTLTSPTNAQLLVYNSSTSQWVNQNPAVVSTPTLAQVTTAGNTTTNNISVGSTFVVGDWTSRPTNVYVRAATGGAENRGYYIGVGSGNDGNGGSLTYNATTNFLSLRSPYNSGTISLSLEGNTNSVQFHNTSGTVVSKFVSSTGNLLIGTTTDAGYKLNVNGTANVGAGLTVSSFIRAGQLSFWDQGRIGATANGTSFAASYNAASAKTLWFWGDMRFGAFTTPASIYYFGARYGGTVSTYALANFMTLGVSGPETFGANTGTTTGTILNIIPPYNYTGGTHTVRGIYYNPTLTSMTGVTHRAIETVTGDVILGSTSGNVGVGTTNPLYKLHVSATAGDIVYIIASTGQSAVIGATGSGTNRMYIGYSPGGENISITSSGVVRLNSITSGNVLIGTTTDAGYKLDIDGTFRATGIVYADSTINQPTSFGNKLLFMNSGNYSKIALADGTNWSLDYHSGITVADVGYHRFYTGSTSGWVERLRIENNGNVGIGTTTPTAKLHIKGTGDSSVWVTTDDFNSGTNTGTVVRIGTRSSTGNTQGWIDALNSGVSSYGNLIIAGFGGNVLIGTTTDAGYKLDVNGTARVSGTIRVGSTFNGTLATLADFRGASDANFVQIARETDTNRGVKIYASGMIIASSIETSGAAYSFLNNVSGSASSGNRLFFNISGGWAPTSGTASWDQVRLNPTINTTGTYAGIVRGIYYNPTLTSLTGTTHRAIETVTGDVIFGSTSGNVGIGTTTPTDKLHIVDNTNGNKFARISAGGTDASAAWVAQNDQVDNVVYRVFGSAVSGTQMGISLARSASLLANLGGSGKFLVGTYSSTDFVMGTGNQERMRLVDSTGNFLVGTTTDLGNKLEVSGTVNATAYKINNVIGYTGILNIPTNPPGQQNVDIQSGIVVNIF